MDTKSRKQYERTPREALRIARRLGKAKGEGWADVQYLPGGGRDTAPDAAGRAAAMLKTIDEGGLCDVGIETPCWLSGEWADEPTVRDIAEACGIDEERDEDGETANECADAYIDAADQAFSDYILRHLRSVAQGAP